VGDFNTSLSVMDRLWKQTKQRHSETNRSYEPKDLTSIYSTFYPKTNGYTVFSALHSTFSKTDYIMSHKTILNRYKKIEIISCILSDHHRPRLVFNNNKNNRKPTYT
jgi:exonuclease III